MYYFETAWNVSRHTGIDGSPWERRLGEPFLGMIILFLGAAATFISNKASRLWREKKPFGNRTIKGIFMGWHLQSGCRWTGGYDVAAVSDFDGVYLKEDVAGRAVRPQRCSSVCIAKDNGRCWAILMQERYELG